MQDLVKLLNLFKGTNEIGNILTDDTELHDCQSWDCDCHGDCYGDCRYDLCRIENHE